MVALLQSRVWKRLLWLLLGVISYPSWAQLQNPYEAESSPTTYAQCTVVSGTPGYLKLQQRGALGTQANASWVTFTVTPTKTGRYSLTLRYASAEAYVRTLSVYVNGSTANRDVAQAQFPSTGDWNTWATQSVTVTLAAGSNTIMYRCDNDDNGQVSLII